MSLCSLCTSNVQINPGQEIMLTWENPNPNTHHTKPEYIKILQDASYNIQYDIKWTIKEKTSQPLCLTIYKVNSGYLLETLDQHVTVNVGSPINVRKVLNAKLKNLERICIGAKNFSIHTLTLLECTFSLSN